MAKSSKIISDYNQMVSHLTLANHHQQKANAIAARLGVLLGPVQEPAPKRGKGLSDEMKAKILASRQRRLAKYTVVPYVNPNA